MKQLIIRQIVLTKFENYLICITMRIFTDLSYFLEGGGLVGHAEAFQSVNNFFNFGSLPPFVVSLCHND